MDSIMEKTPKISDVLQSTCYETCRNIPKKTPMERFTKKNSLTRQILFSESQQQLLIYKSNV